MKLILLYGPPAVGKLTIAKEIARLTGFKVFHNHLTVNLVAAILPRGTPAYRQLLWDIRYAVFAEAARANLEGLIFTMVYRHDQEPCIARGIEIVERFGGKVCFVHVYCRAETVRQRVVRADRKPHGKITSVELLNELLSHWEPQSTFEVATQWDSLSLNTDVLGPAEAAQQAWPITVSQPHSNGSAADAVRRRLHSRCCAVDAWRSASSRLRQIRCVPLEEAPPNHGMEADSHFAHAPWPLLIHNVGRLIDDLYLIESSTPWYCIKYHHFH